MLGVLENYFSNKTKNKRTYNFSEFFTELQLILGYSGEGCQRKTEELKSFIQPRKKKEEDYFLQIFIL